MDNILKTAIKVELPAARASCHNTTDLTTDASESVRGQIILKFFFRERGTYIFTSVG